MARTACLTCLISTISACSKKAKNAVGRGSTSSGRITKLEQSRFSLDIYGIFLGNVYMFALYVYTTISMGFQPLVPDEKKRGEQIKY
jgi:hypothetical protein